MDISINLEQLNFDTEDMALKLHNQKNFALEIERLVKEGGLTYIEAVTEFMNQTNIEPEKIKKLLTHKIKNEIESEAIKYNMSMFRGQKPDDGLEFED